VENVFSLALFFTLLSYLLCEMGKYFFLLRIIPTYIPAIDGQIVGCLGIGGSAPKIE